MKNKILSLFGLGILALVVLTSLASAAISFTNQLPSVLPLTTGAQTFTINVTGNATENITFSGLASITENGKTITFTLPANIINATGSPQSLTINYNVPADFEFFFGKTYSTTLTATGTTSPAVSQTISFKVNTPSLYADDGNLDVAIDDITVEKGFGEDTSWFPLDEISAKINIENSNSNSDDKIRNIVVEWGLYDRNTGKWVVKEKESKFNLNSGDDKTLTVNFKLNKPDKFQGQESDVYVFYAWATGDNEAFNDNKTSMSDSESIDINIDSDFVVLDSINLPDTAACGSEVQLTADVWNIGDSDQQNVYVQIINTKLGINKKVELGDIDSFEKKQLDFTFTVPTDLEIGNFPIKLTVYDENDDVYQSNNDDESTQTAILNIKEACVFNPKLTIAAAIESGGKAGQELVVKATVKNTDTKTRTFTVNAAGYASWAELVELSAQKIALDAGETGEITVTLNIDKNVVGDQTFSIEFVEGNRVVPQVVTVTVEKPAGFFSFLTGNTVKGSSNWYIWAIGALNVLLVLMIIIVAVRVARKK